MGFFSFITQDTNKSICNVHSPRKTFTVYMMDDKGNLWTEDEYQGYGVFGGKDYYELLAEMNGKTTRDEGISLAFGKEPFLSPNLVEDPSKLYDWKAPKDCPNQGYFYEDDEETAEQNTRLSEQALRVSIDIYREAAEDTLSDFEVKHIGSLADFIDVDSFCLSELDGANEIDLKDIIYYMLDSQGAFYVECIYYNYSIDYLSKEDPSLTRSFELAEEQGYTLSNLTSETLASIHASEDSRQDFLNTNPLQFENLLIALTKYYEAKAKL